MKKIMLIVPSLARGGVERVVSVLSKEFNQSYQVFVVIYHGPVEYKTYGKLINLETPTGSFIRKIMNNFDRIIKLKRLINETGPDYIISFMGNLQPILTFSPLIVSVHSNPDYFPKFYRKLFLKTIYKLPTVKKVITVSRGIEKKLNSNYGLKKTKTIYNPIDLKLIKQKMLARRPVDFDYILAVGRLSREKCLDILINAFVKSKIKNKLKLIILGEGKERKNLKQLINKLDATEQVLLFGKVDNPFIYMKYAKFFVLASKSEGLGLVIIEALACGTPVIATNCDSGPSEIINHEKNGLLVPVEDEDALRRGMEKLFYNVKLYQKLKENAAGSVKKFDIRNTNKDWIKLFQDMDNSP